MVARKSLAFSILHFDRVANGKQTLFARVQLIVLGCQRRAHGLAGALLSSCGHTASLPFLVMQTFTQCGAEPWRHECASSPETISSQNTYPCRKVLGALALTPPLTLSQRNLVMSESLYCACRQSFH